MGNNLITIEKQPLLLLKIVLLHTLPIYNDKYRKVYFFLIIQEVGHHKHSWEKRVPH